MDNQRNQSYIDQQGWSNNRSFISFLKVKFHFCFLRVWCVFLGKFRARRGRGGMRGMRTLDMRTLHGDGAGWGGEGDLCSRQFQA